MIRLTPIPILLLFLWTASLLAQRPGSTFPGCGGPAYRQATQEDPTGQARWESFNRKWATTAESGFDPGVKRSTYVIPIVFHVVHQNGEERLPEDRVRAALALLNDAFADAGAYAGGGGAATNIEFCLASRSEDNRSVEGIRYFKSPFTELEAPQEEREIKDRHWRTDEYLNVYSVREICGLGLGCSVGGYSSFPSNAGRWRDGVVIESRFLADDPAAVPVLAHEIGHYLGLYHTFVGGCNNRDCNRDGDQICDTPPDNSEAGSPCDDPENSCGTDPDSGFDRNVPDATWNFMDYGNFDCASGFSPLQGERMRLVIEEERTELLTSFGCQPLCTSTIATDFAPRDTTVQRGVDFSYAPQLTNVDRLEWRINGRLRSTDASFEVPVLEDARLRMSLTLYSGGEFCRTRHFRWEVLVRCPPNFGIQTEQTRIVRLGDTVRLSASPAGYVGRWSVNGEVVADGVVLDFVATERGEHQISLESTEGNCQGGEFLISVFDTTTSVEYYDSCQATFRLDLPSGPNGGDVSAILDWEGTDLILAVGNGTILRSTPSGIIKWIHHIDERVEIKVLRLDQEGQLLAVGHSRGENNQFNPGVIAKIDMERGTVSWIRYVQAQAIDIPVRFNAINIDGADNTYLVVGGVGSQFIPARPSSPAIFRIDRDTGEPRGPAMITQRSSSAEYLSGTHLSGTDLYYLLSNDLDGSVRVSVVTAVRPDGSVAWQKRYRGDLLDTNDGISGLAPYDIGSVGNTLGLSGLAYNASRRGQALVEIDANGQIQRGRMIRQSVSGSWQFRNKRYLLATDSSFVTWAPKLSGMETPLYEWIGQQETVYTHRLMDRFWSRETSLKPSPYRQGFLVPLWNSNTGVKTVGNFIPGASSECNPIVTFLQPNVSTVALIASDSPYTFETQPLTSTLGTTVAGDFAFGVTSCPGYCPEVCDNGEDDDYNGFTDCDDPALADDCCCRTSVAEIPWTDEPLCPGGNTFSLTGTYDSVRTAPGLDRLSVPGPPSFRATLPGVYWIEASDDCGLVYRDTVTVGRATELPVLLPPDTAICDPTEVVLRPDATAYTDLRWSDGSTGPALAVRETGRYAVTATDACGTVHRDTFVMDSARRARIDLQVLAETCTGAADGVVVIATPAAGLRYQLGDRPVQETPEFSDLPAGPYALTVFDGAGCDQWLNLTVPTGDSPTVYLPDRTIRPLGEPLTVRGSANVPIDRWEWTSSYGDDCSGCEELRLLPTGRGWVELTVTGTTGCPATARTDVVPYDGPLVYLPNAFSPNGDGINDTWQPLPGPAVESITSIEVYDRFGGMVFASQGGTPWSGERLPTGAYVYVVTVRLLDGRTVTRSGQLTLLR